MKNKIIYIVSVIVSLFIGISGTLLVLHFFPLTYNSIEKTVNEVSITEENSINSSINKVYDAVVLIETYSRGSSLSSGTGFIYKKDNKYSYIITNHHVIDSASSIDVTLTSGEKVSANLLGSDEYSDIAVLAIDSSHEVTLANFGSSTSSLLGDTVFTIGSPLGKDYMGTVTKGILSGKDRLVTVSTTGGSFVMEVLQTDAAINPGNSGGPLLNINGEVIGVTSIKLVQNEIEGMGFAIPIEMVMNYIERLEKGEKIQRPLFGIELLDVTDTYYLYRNQIILDSSIDSGIVVVNITNDSPAKKAGFEKGDVILEIDGVEIKDSAYFRFALYKYEVGDTIKVKYFRNNKIEEVEMKLDKSV